MSLTMKPKPARTMIIERWLNDLSPADFAEATTYLNDPDTYAHTEIAKMVSASLGYRISDRAVRGWRQRNL